MNICTTSHTLVMTHTCASLVQKIPSKLHSVWWNSRAFQRKVTIGPPANLQALSVQCMCVMCTCICLLCMWYDVQWCWVEFLVFCITMSKGCVFLNSVCTLHCPKALPLVEGFSCTSSWGIFFCNCTIVVDTLGSCTEVCSTLFSLLWCRDIFW